MDCSITFDSIEDVIADIAQGRMVILVDDEDRENEGDLVMAAEKVTPEAINFMATHGRGLICLALSPERVEELQLPLMVNENTAAFGTAFTVSIDARKGITTGISAKDRAVTILTAVDPKTRPADLARPGHLFPLRADKGGVLKRAGVAVAVANGICETKESADYVTRTGGGHGAVREVAELILKAQGKWKRLVQEYSS